MISGITPPTGRIIADHERKLAVINGCRKGTINQKSAWIRLCRLSCRLLRPDYRILMEIETSLITSDSLSSGIKGIKGIIPVSHAPPSPVEVEIAI